MLLNYKLNIQFIIVGISENTRIMKKYNFNQITNYSKKMQSLSVSYTDDGEEFIMSFSLKMSARAARLTFFFLDRYWLVVLVLHSNSIINY